MRSKAPHPDRTQQAFHMPAADPSAPPANAPDSAVGTTQIGGASSSNAGSALASIGACDSFGERIGKMLVSIHETRVNTKTLTSRPLNFSEGGPFPKGYFLVTQNIPRGDAMWYTEQSRKAIDKEISMLLNNKVYDPNEVFERDWVVSNVRDAQFVPLNPILAQKHVELPESMRTMKCRIVAGGDQIRDAQGTKLPGKGDSMALLPAALSSIRVVMAFGYFVQGV